MFFRLVIKNQDFYSFKILQHGSGRVQAVQNGGGHLQAGGADFELNCHEILEDFHEGNGETDRGAQEGRREEVRFNDQFVLVNNNKIRRAISRDRLCVMCTENKMNDKNMFLTQWYIK